MLLHHNDPAVRLNVCRALVPDNDPVAVDAVVKGLKNPADAPVPTAEAIDLLNEAGAINYLEALRPFIDDRDPIVQARAIDALALDPTSRPKIVQYLRDKTRPTPIRVAALHSLNRAGDSQYPVYATDALSDQSAPVELRTAAIRETLGFLNYHKVPEDQQIRFAEAVERLGAEQPVLPGIKDTPAKVLEYLRKTSPAVEKHYRARDK